MTNSVPTRMLATARAYVSVPQIVCEDDRGDLRCATGARVTSTTLFAAILGYPDLCFADVCNGGACMGTPVVCVPTRMFVTAQVPVPAASSSPVRMWL